MRNRNRLVGFTYDEAAGIAHFSMYVPGTAGRDRKRATVNAATYDDAVRLWSEFRSRAAEGLQRPSPEAPTFREFITEYFPSIAANLAVKTARDYRWAIHRYLLPQLGALRLDEITSGILNRLGARLNAAGYAGATVNNYVNLAALLLGYAVELDVVADLPLKKKIKKQKANKPCLELNAEERARFLAAFDDEAGFRRFLAEVMPKAKPAVAKDTRRLGASLCMAFDATVGGADEHLPQFAAAAPAGWLSVAWGHLHAPFRGMRLRRRRVELRLAPRTRPPRVGPHPCASNCVSISCEAPFGPSPSMSVSLTNSR